MTQRLEPAHTIIKQFGGPAAVKRITGISGTRIYRWTRPKSAGGTDGFIPIQHARKLLEYAKANDIPVSAEQFLTGEGAAQ